MIEGWQQEWKERLTCMYVLEMVALAKKTGGRPVDTKILGPGLTNEYVRGTAQVEWFGDKSWTSAEEG